MSHKLSDVYLVSCCLLSINKNSVLEQVQLFGASVSTNMNTNIRVWKPCVQTICIKTCALIRANKTRV